ncbi:caspase family protein [Pontixanthobacter sp. CEM42]|uniref:caspase family protein n=1 Tax=Pontixanthobacter sp. CEM42 TaxID=2792077 RepID=UPI001ADF2C54|nr:caspase family protein [Pontixanthobacter sp. CEM42]
MTQDITQLEFVYRQFGNQTQEFARTLAEASARTTSGDPTANLVIGPDGVEPGCIRLKEGKGKGERLFQIAVCVEGLDPKKSRLAKFIEAEVAFRLGTSGEMHSLAEPKEDLRDTLKEWCDLASTGQSATRNAVAPLPVIVTRPVKRSSRVNTLPPAFTGSPEQLEKLQPHVINMNHGQLSDSGMMRMTESDLDRVVDGIVKNCVEGNRTLMMHAHGGLNSEEVGLSSAWDYHRWWLDNGVYPLYFVWETGALDALWHVIAGERRVQAQARGITDWTDRIVEKTTRKIGRVLWSEMKRNAQRCASRGGGAELFTRKLLRQVDSDESGNKTLRAVAVGHSAGAIFHAHFLPRLKSANGVKFDQLHLLAPALNQTDFEKTLVDVLDTRKPQVTLYTMTRKAELADNVGGVYRKSLLYLVRNAFEEGKDPQISGLQESREDTAIFRKYMKEVVWSPTVDGAGSPRSRSCSPTHGGFDNDPATMESVMRRVLDLSDDLPLPAGFPTERSRAAPPEPVRPPSFYGIPYHLHADFVPGGALSSPSAPLAGPALPPPPPDASGGGAVLQPATPAGRKKIALCIGNNAFRGQPLLHGCINDAEEWKRVFEAVGFQASVAADCTADRMRDEIRRLTGAARPGDVIALQISSHGTQIRDQDGDELRDDERADMHDEALIGIDADRGGLIIDDEWAQLLAVPAGVRVIRFHDFCSSGRSSRMASPPGQRVRFAPLTHAQEGAALAQLAAKGIKRASTGATYNEQLTDLTFVACEPDKFAYESGGMGDFTKAATRILKGAGQTMSAQQLIEAVRTEMAGGKQIPDLEGPAHLRSGGIFEPLV